jgi:hypothetical protein
LRREGVMKMGDVGGAKTRLARDIRYSTWKRSATVYNTLGVEKESMRENTLVEMEDSAESLQGTPRVHVRFMDIIIKG